MTQNRRIALNIVATYGRSLYSLVCGLFTARWVLMALGQSDFGLYGVVGGLTAFIVFFNGLLASAVGRFYAFYVGAARTNIETGVEDCRKWFNTAVLLHTVIPVVLLIIGYPIGEWAVRCFLTIPPDRVQSCVWVWRFVCLACFVSMVNVPFQAMYGAKQEIAELTIYSFATTTFNVVVLYYMVSHPGVWLVGYAAWMCVMQVVPSVIIGVRAVVCYPECRFVWRYMWSVDRIKQIAIYAGGRFWTAFSMVCQTQGQAILVNKYLGPVSNATMSVGNGVASQTQTLAASTSGAFWPAITNAAGEGDFEKMRRLTFSTCKLSSLMLLVFALPLSLEAHEVIRLWLKDPPELAAEICICVLAASVLERLADGHWMCVYALGRILGYSFAMSLVGFSALAAVWGVLAVGWGLMGIGAIIVIAKAVSIVVRVVYAKTLADLSVSYWLRHVLFPFTVVISVALMGGLVPRMIMGPSFGRVILTTIFAEIIMEN